MLRIKMVISLLKSNIWVLLAIFFFPITITIFIPYYLITKQSLFKSMGIWVLDYILFSPNRLKRFCWQSFYYLLVYFINSKDWTCLNYGYHISSGHFIEETSKEIYCLQLYHFMASGFGKFSDLKGLKIAEIGSGRGGGLKYIAKTLRPNTAIGIDFSQAQVTFSNAINDLKNLKFIQGDAENIPIFHETIDLILNIENSHCYSDLFKFFSEVKRVLKQKGHFLYADFMTPIEAVCREKWFFDLGFKIIEKKDITENVLLSMEMENTRKFDLLNKIGWLGKKAFSEFIGVKNSIIYNRLSNRDTIYLAYHLVKKHN